MNQKLFFLSLFFLMCNTNVHAAKNFVQAAFGWWNTKDIDLEKSVAKKKDTELSLSGENGETPIMTALIKDYFLTAEALIKKKVSLSEVSDNQVEKHFNFLLKYTVLQNVSERLIAFVQKKENILRKSFFGETSIIVSKTKKENTAERTSFEQQNHSILHWAAATGNQDLLISIFEKGKEAAVPLLAKFWKELLEKLPEGGTKNACAQLIKDYALFALTDDAAIKDALDLGAHPDFKRWDGKTPKDINDYFKKEETKENEKVVEAKREEEKEEEEKEEETKNVGLPTLTKEQQDAQNKYQATLKTTKRPMLPSTFTRKKMEKSGRFHVTKKSLPPLDPHEEKIVLTNKIKLYEEAIKIHKSTHSGHLRNSKLSLIDKQLKLADEKKVIGAIAGVSFSFSPELETIESIEKKIEEDKVFLTKIEEKINLIKPNESEEKIDEPEEKDDVLGQSLTELAAKLDGLKGKLKNLADLLALLKTELTNPSES